MNHVTSNHVTSNHVTSNHVTSNHVTSNHVTSNHVTSSHVASRPVPDAGRGSIPRVLSIAGTDPTGGAGTAADIKSIQAAGGFGMAVVTALVAQNTHGVRGVHEPPLSFLQQQLDAVGDDVALDAVKTGMLGTAGVIELVEAWLGGHRPSVVVVDPVMVATSGHRLLASDAESAMRRFCRRATVVTPNIDELAVLTGRDPACDERVAIDQARRWAADSGTAVVVKTGHLDSRRASNTWVDPHGRSATVVSWRVETPHTHGTGCSLSSALATRLARGDDPATALAWVTDWLHEAIDHADALRVGSGHGPVDHAHRARRLAAAADAMPWLTPSWVPAEWHEPEDLLTTTGPDPDSAAPAAGPWTDALWRAGAGLTAAMEHGDFVRRLRAGTLDAAHFDFYIGQDTVYLGQYARALAALGTRSREFADVAYWSAAAAHCHDAESMLHRNWLRGALPEPSPVTSAYTSYLMATTMADPLVVGAAAVLPCFWLYAHIGAGLAHPDADHPNAEHPNAEHPYAEWLGTYGDPGFAAATRESLAVVERLLSQATPADRAAAARAYLTCCRHELEFFDQALRVDPSPSPGGNGR